MNFYLPLFGWQGTMNEASGSGRGLPAFGANNPNATTKLLTHLYRAGMTNATTSPRATIIFIGMMILSIFICLHTIMDESDYEKHKRKQLEERRKKAGKDWEITWNKGKGVFVYISEPGFKESGEPKCSKLGMFKVSEYPKDKWLREPENKEKTSTRWGMTKEERLNVSQEAVNSSFKSQHQD